MVSLKAFRYVAVLEATTFLMLLVASYLKATDHGAVGVQILGPIHGALFLLYVGFVALLYQSEGWSTKTTALIVLGAVVPFGGYVVDWKLLRDGEAAEQPEG